MEKAFYKKPHYLALWVHLLLSANHDESEFMWNGGVLKVKSGQFVTGRKQLSAQSGIPETTVEDILSFLEREQQIRQQKTTKYRLITIVKWGQYQNSDNKATTKRQQADTNKNEKNEKNLLSEANASGTNGKDMGWKNKPSDNDDDLPVVDMDSGEVVVQNNEKTELKELNEKIRHNLKLIEPLRGIPWGIGKDMNFHVKAYRELLKNGWGHEAIISAFVELVGTEHWKSEKEKGNFPGMNTVQFTLRNKQPK